MIFLFARWCEKKEKIQKIIFELFFVTTLPCVLYFEMLRHLCLTLHISAAFVLYFCFVEQGWGKSFVMSLNAALIKLSYLAFYVL